MSAGRTGSWRFLWRLLGWFLLLCLLSQAALSTYVSGVVVAAETCTNLVGRHGVEVTFREVTPRISWAATVSAATVAGSLSPHLLTYNGLLYLALVLALPGWPPLSRVRLAFTGVPILFLFHVADLMLAVESQLLTSTQPQHYAFWHEFDLWFVLVKFSHSFSVLALKQVLPALILYMQCRALARWFVEYRSPIPWSRGTS